MYTQCPECETIFAITAADLAVAGGFVRCGQCTVSFDALNSLRDEQEILSADSNKTGADQVSETEQNDSLQSGADRDSSKESSDVAAAGDDARTADDNVTAQADDQHNELNEGMPDSGDPNTAGAQSYTAEEDNEPKNTEALTKDKSAVADADATEKSKTAAIEDDTPAADDQEKQKTATADHADQQKAMADKMARLISDDDDESQSEQAGIADDVDDDDEILLDEDYRPPADDADDNELLLDGDEADSEFDVFFGDAEIRSLVDEQGESTKAAEDTETRKDDGLNDEQDEKSEDVDESALFDLQLPELRALEQSPHVQLPEKLEGGGDGQRSAAGVTAITRKGRMLSRLRQTMADRKIRDNDAVDAEDAKDLRDYLSDPKNRKTAAAWLGGSALMAFLLVAQVVHRNRGDLVIHPRVGPLVSSIYRTIGVELRPNWQIQDYKVVGQARLFEMPTAQPDEADDSTALRFVTIITNGAKLPQPAPMVRLTLRDRWGDPTGVRDFTPPEYLADRSLIGQLLEPGQRLRVVLNIADPGTDVVGFDFDMCLPDGVGTLRCANEAGG